MNNFQNSSLDYITRIQNLGIIFLFFICCIEFSVQIMGMGVTANYFYMLFPFIFLIQGMQRRLVIRKEMLLIFSVFIIIYLIRSPIEVIDLEVNLYSIFRRFASFLVFMFPLVLSFIEFKSRDIYLFKMAVILACLLYSINKIILFVSVKMGYFVWADHTASLVTESINLKGIVGSQRYGFVLLFAFFITLFQRKLFFESKVVLQKIFILLILLISLYITFSRATFVAFLATVLIFTWRRYFTNHYFNIGMHKVSSLTLKLKGALVIVGLFGLLFLLFYFFSDSGVLSYYKERFIQPFMPDSAGFMMNPDSSEGYRLYLISKVLDYVSLHPISGSNFQGLFMLYDEFKGGVSTHNQYMDVLLRVGLIGVILWLYLLYRIYKFCKNDDGLLFGLIAILIYGLVHETFKLSYGSFLFGMLLSFSYSFVKTKGSLK